MRDYQSTSSFAGSEFFLKVTVGPLLFPFRVAFWSFRGLREKGGVEEAGVDCRLRIPDFFFSGDSREETAFRFCFFFFGF